MSDSIYPVFPGLSWPRVRTPKWKTYAQESASGMESRSTYWSYPRWQWSLSYDLLRAGTLTELQQLVGFYCNMLGSFDTFLYTDPDDNTATGQGIGSGTGSLKKFQLARSYGGFVEPIKNINGTPKIYLNGVLQSSGYSIDANGIVTFTSAPGAGVLVTADFSYYFRCRFVDDSYDFSQFMYQLWELKKIEFISVKDDN